CEAGWDWRYPRFEGSVQPSRGPLFWRETTRPRGPEAGRAGARIETVGARRPRASRSRGYIHRRLFLRHRANRRTHARRRGTICEESPRWNDGIDVPSWIRGCGPAEDTDAPAGFTPDRAADSY